VTLKFSRRYGCDQADSRARRRVLHRVFDDVCEHLPDQLAIAPDCETAENLSSEGLSSFVGHRLIDLGHCTEHVGQIDFAKMMGRDATFDLRDAQQCAERFEDRIRLGNAVCRCGLPFRGGPRSPLRLFKTLPKPSQRGAQIVRDAVRHLVHAFHRALYAVEHHVQACHQMIEFIVGVANRDTPRKVA